MTRFFDTFVEDLNLDDAWHEKLSEILHSYWVARVPIHFSETKRQDGFVKIRVRTDIVTVVSNAESARAVCLQLNQLAGLWTFAFDEDSLTFCALASSLIESAPLDDLEELRFSSLKDRVLVALLAQSAIDQAIIADSIAEPLAQLLGGVPNFTYPSNQSDLREIPDATSGLRRILRERPEYIADEFPNGNFPSAETISAQHLQSLNAIASAHELSVRQTENTTPGAAYALETRSNNGTVAQDTFGLIRTAEFGTTLRFQTTFGIHPDDSAASLANALVWSLWNDNESSLLGHFQSAANSLVYRQDIPLAYLRSMESDFGFANSIYPVDLFTSLAVLTHQAFTTSLEVESSSSESQVSTDWNQISEQVAPIFDSLQAAATAALAVTNPDFDDEDAHRELLDLLPAARLVTFGTFNPNGPTVTSIELFTLNSGDYAMAVMARHPYLPKYGVVAHVRSDLADLTEALRVALPNAMPQLIKYIDLEDCPESHLDIVKEAVIGHIMNVAREREIDLVAETAKTELFLTEPWGLASDGLVDRDRSSEPQAPSFEAAEEFLTVASHPAHIQAHWRFVPDAWDGSLNYNLQRLPLVAPDLRVVWTYNKLIGVVPNQTQD